MNTPHCCQIKTRAGDKTPRPASQLRRGGEIAGWFLPSATLVLLPKCPACVAAYIALVSGVGISVATATYLRASLLILCVTALACLALKRLCRLGGRQGRAFAKEMNATYAAGSAQCSHLQDRGATRPN